MFNIECNINNVALKRYEMTIRKGFECFVIMWRYVHASRTHEIVGWYKTMSIRTLAGVDYRSAPKTDDEPLSDSQLMSVRLAKIQTGTLQLSAVTEFYNAYFSTELQLLFNVES